MRARTIFACLAALAAPLGCHERKAGGTYTDPQAVPVVCARPPVLAASGLNDVPDPGAGACVKTPRDSSLPPVPPSAFGWTDLGALTVGGEVTFDIPPGTASLTLMEQAVSAIELVTVTIDGVTGVMENGAVITDLRDPAGKLFYDDLVVGGPVDGSGSVVYFASPAAVAGTLTVPNTSAGLGVVGVGGLAPGTWKVTVNDYARECWLAAQSVPPPAFLGRVSCDLASQRNDGTYRLFVLTKPAAVAPGIASAVPDTGTVDVAFHLLDALNPPPGDPAIGLTAAQAVADARIQRMVETYARLLANAGLCIDTVRFYDEPDWARLRFATGVDGGLPGPCGNLGQIFTLSVPGQRTVEVFLVPRVGLPDPTTGRVALGIDGSIPGPATVNGTVASGAVASAEDLASGPCPAPGSPPDFDRCGADLVAYVAAHESGHYLGLYHPTEFDGQQFDPIADTPHCECPFCGMASCATGVPATTRCNQRRERCSGAMNLMFWVVGPDNAGILSPQQGRVVRASPVVRHP